MGKDGGGAQRGAGEEMIQGGGYSSGNVGWLGHQLFLRRHVHDPAQLPSSGSDRTQLPRGRLYRDSCILDFIQYVIPIPECQSCTPSVVFRLVPLGPRTSLFALFSFIFMLKKFFSKQGTDINLKYDIPLST